MELKDYYKNYKNVVTVNVNGSSNTQITNKKDIATVFNQFFIEIGERISGEIPKQPQYQIEKTTQAKILISCSWKTLQIRK